MCPRSLWYFADILSPADVDRQGTDVTPGRVPISDSCAPRVAVARVSVLIQLFPANSDPTPRNQHAPNQLLRRPPFQTSSARGTAAFHAPLEGIPSDKEGGLAQWSRARKSRPDRAVVQLKSKQEKPMSSRRMEWCRCDSNRPRCRETPGGQVRSRQDAQSRKSSLPGDSVQNSKGRMHLAAPIRAPHTPRIARDRRHTHENVYLAPRYAHSPRKASVQLQLGIPVGTPSPQPSSVSRALSFG